MATPSVRVKHTPRPAPDKLTSANRKSPELMNGSTVSSDAPSNHQPPPQPPFINSITELRGLSTTLSTFIRRYDDLQAHLDFIRTNIDPVTEQFVPSLYSNENHNAAAAQSELERICERECGRNLRVYFISRLLELDKLRKEAPTALKRSQDPAKLVMTCFGRFYLQGVKAYTKDSPMITSREASIFALECFLLMGCDGVVIELPVKEEAESAASAWRKRLVIEGGLNRASEPDSRGLLLLISCFGIPPAFTTRDIMDLLWSCNLRKIAAALRRSTFLNTKIPDVLEEMVKNKLEIDAVDLAYTLHVENFPLKTLKLFLSKSEESWKTTKKQAKDSSTAMIRADKRQLGNLNSVIKCLEKHNLDPSKLLPEWKVREKISNLDKEISNLDLKKEVKSEQKRKSGETKYPKIEMKRPRVADSLVQQQPQPKVNVYSAPSTLHLKSGAVPDSITSSLIAGNVGGLLAAWAGGNLSAAHGGFTGLPSPQKKHSAKGFAGSPSQQHMTKGFPGLPSQQTGGGPGAAWDLYHFADVLESELNKGGH